jgi:hypothetical protein
MLYYIKALSSHKFKHNKDIVKWYNDGKWERVVRYYSYDQTKIFYRIRTGSLKEFTFIEI